ncbi:hypothetical protein [Bradyrhizobium lablabi]|jgi:hypothetical protein|uniref:hypothetical protein n=1 Tax=Bradyrhizobium lablabi TaxID=722472 RepID=UPI00090A1938|nr:hypothetical protein [Bradyrhizobium lablabi]SHK69812.1 hypothetical protein SAMN05444321_0377 [Bradyrhizobium lablabi]
MTFSHIALATAAVLTTSLVHQVDLKMGSSDGVQRLEQLWVVTYVDNGGREIVARAKLTTGDYAPLIAADAARLESIIPVAREIAKANNVTLQIVKFSNRLIVEEIKP